MQDAYIIAGSRSAVGKAIKGTLRDVRPDDLAAHVVRHLVASLPEFDPNLIHDVIVGNASPEAEQGLNVGRLISLMGLDTEKVPGMTVNRYLLQRTGDHRHCDGQNPHRHARRS